MPVSALNWAPASVASAPRQRAEAAMTWFRAPSRGFGVVLRQAWT